MNRPRAMLQNNIGIQSVVTLWTFHTNVVLSKKVGIRKKFDLHI
ncbi:hypothetical protein T05_6264 [Trichinella murrelli]|uniref:Uncharacterized protein n=1 Tax=Trichinella murrelli TaxID=144512 RepID=A0A0V0SP34_9BILA|nr:hypothetical protein T05_6264 [Trichinella murrelli]